MLDVSGARALVALGAALLAACAGNGEGLDANGQPLGSAGGTPPPLTADFQSIQDNVFTPVCVRCHSGAGAPQGLQLDAASGDHDLHDDRVGTFNPMFPNGYYETLSGYTGYANFIHVKPSLTLVPAPGVKVLGAIGELWRQTTRDAIYAQPSIALPGTAGEAGRRSATYAELRVDWIVSRDLAFALETERYQVAQVVRNAGGHDSTYLGAEVRWGW